MAAGIAAAIAMPSMALPATAHAFEEPKSWNDAQARYAAAEKERDDSEAREGEISARIASTGNELQSAQELMRASLLRTSSVPKPVQAIAGESPDVSSPIGETKLYDAAKQEAIAERMGELTESLKTDKAALSEAREARRESDREAADLKEWMGSEAGADARERQELEDERARRAKARQRIVELAASKLGGPYVWGASGPTAFDCSGLVMWCYAQLGYDLPHYSEGQAAWCDKPMSEAEPGDICWRPGHVGICIGDGRTIEAHSPARGIDYGTTSSFDSCGSPID